MILDAWLKGPANEHEAVAMNDGADALGRLRLALTAGIKLALDPNDTQQVFYLARAAGLARLPQLKERLSTTELGRGLLAERPAIDRESVDFDALRALPADSLGGAYVRMLDSKGLTPDIFERPPGLPEDLAWIGQRLRQTHDLWHLLTGLETDVPGEIALQAFTYGQAQLRLSWLLMVFGVLIFSARHPQLYWLAKRWHARGQHAAFLLEIPWERHWSEPLAKVRADLRIRPVSAA
ncbi:MAG: Coq4 family protein [Polyangiales bacterium]